MNLNRETTAPRLTATLAQISSTKSTQLIWPQPITLILVKPLSGTFFNFECEEKLTLFHDFPQMRNFLGKQISRWCVWEAEWLAILATALVYLRIRSS